MTRVTVTHFARHRLLDVSVGGSGRPTGSICWIEPVFNCDSSAFKGRAEDSLKDYSYQSYSLHFAQPVFAMPILLLLHSHSPYRLECADQCCVALIPKDPASCQAGAGGPRLLGSTIGLDSPACRSNCLYAFELAEILKSTIGSRQLSGILIALLASKSNRAESCGPVELQQRIKHAQ